MPIKPTVPVIAPEDFSQLSANEQFDVLRGLDSRHKTRLLLDAENGAELLARLPTQEVYLLAVERGPEHLPELLSLASPEQWSGFIDLDCWQGDQFTVNRTHRWLVALLQADQETVFNVLREMNFEQLVLICKAELEIISGPEADEDSDARIDAQKRDGGYEISYRSEQSAKLFGRILDILQNFQPEFLVYLLEAVRAENFSLIEESVYQQRIGRLQDMGIPDPHSAGRVYAWLDPDQYRENRPDKISPGHFDGSAPGFPLTMVRPKGLLAAALADGLEENLAWELTSMVNKVIMADRIAMDQLDQVRKVLDKVDAYLNLALEWLVGQDVAAARVCLSDCYSEDLFRLGYSLTVTLQRRAEKSTGTTVAAYLDPAARACLAALRNKPPLLYEGIVDATRGGTRLFTSLAEIRKVEQWLARIELQCRLFDDVLKFSLPDPKQLDLSGCQPDQAAELTVVELFLTSLANKLLGRDFQPLPIAEEELAGLHGMVSHSGELHPRLRKETVMWLESLLPGGGSFAEYCLDIWQEEFCAVGFEDIDPRFVGGLIIRLANR
ncbi:MAG: DUF6178 family protein [Desulfuromonadales bacterium]